MNKRFDFYHGREWNERSVPDNRARLTNLTQEELKLVLHYSPKTGVFTWKQRISIRLKIGNVAGKRSHGYIRIGIFNSQYAAHRLAWLYMTGQWPVEFIDHINGNRADNRWRNLREADNCINQQNRRVARKGNPTGLIGAMTDRTRFVSHIYANGKRIYLGSFASAEAAHSAYIKAKRVLHPGGQL